MENKLDNLFKEKLSGDKVVPSQEAWNKLNGQLKSNRRQTWRNRLAIAATIILLLSVGFLGYRATEMNNAVIETDNLSINIENEAPNISDDQIENERSVEESYAVEVTSETVELAVNQEIYDTDDEKAVSKQRSNEEELTNQAFLQSQFIATETKPGIKDEMKSETVNEAPINQGGGNLESKEFVAAIDNTAKVDLNESDSDKANPRPKIRIVYKANKDSELVTPGKSTIIDRGINKITDFSAEHLLTTDRKTKLRNTKEDLLALNFGKLLNKSNKDLEN